MPNPGYILEGFLKLGHSVDEVIVLQLEPDGAVDRPGQDDSLLLLDGRQHGEGGLGQVLKEGEPHSGSRRLPTPGVGGSGVG